MRKPSLHGIKYQRAPSGARASAFTLVELLVVVSIIGLLVAILLPSLQKAREQARSAKCLANLHAFVLATQTYLTEYNGTLPGPVFVNIFRHTEQVAPSLQKRSIGYLLRPYFSATAAANRSSSTTDKITTCPTAGRIAPDEDFGGTSTFALPLSYMLNTWGPTDPSDKQWFHTNPHFYFGHNLFSSGSPDYTGANKRFYMPKTIETIKTPSAEWALGDAWYRNIDRGAARPGTSPLRDAVGTFGLEYGSSGASSASVPIPSAPYHGVSYRVARTHKQAAAEKLPEINFTGATNMGYLDGHASAFWGKWLRHGQGGTVNPWWSDKGWGGTHTKWR
ncbi:MAG: DUF1559 domain-containing protein [bacterium]|nr:DUF1559 domain-containing protein [bacterium]